MAEIFEFPEPSHDYIPWRPKLDFVPSPRPAYKHPPIPEGQDFVTMTAKHGRPIGVFESGREHQYNARDRGDQ